MSKITETISKISKIVNLNQSYFPNEAFSTFFYTGNIKSQQDISKLKKNPSITISGNDNNRKYNILFRELYELLKVKEKLISLKSFKDTTQQLFFTDEFNETKINEILDQYRKTNFYIVAKIFGLTMNKPKIEFGKYTFVRKDCIINFINQQMNDEKILNPKEFTYVNLENESKSDRNFIYIVMEIEACDTNYVSEKFENEVLLIINTLRYMTGLKQDRIYIDIDEYVDSISSRVQYTKEGFTGNSTKVNRKDIDVPFDEEYYFSKENGNFQIWSMLIKKQRNELETRIIRAINWLGLSIMEKNNDVACTEIAFSLESLLKLNEQQSPITSSIQGQMSEMIAFICGKNLEERKKIIKDFKAFYSYRSSIVHGGESKEEGEYLKYFYMAKDVLIKILVNNNYLSCGSLQKIKEKLDDIKYS